MRTPKNIIQHELIGLKCRVVEAQNRSNVGINGRILDESMKTLVIESVSGRKRIQKAGSVFRIKLGDVMVDIDGNMIISRPEDRIKKRLSRW